MATTDIDKVPYNFPLPTAFSLLGREWFVSQDHRAASDDNPGTSELPLASVAAAAAQCSKHDAIIIDSGIYREEVVFAEGGNTFLPEYCPVLRAQSGGRVVISGADELDAAWQQVSESVWQAELPSALLSNGAYNPYAIKIGGICRGRFFVDGNEMLQDTRCPQHWRVSDDGRSLIAHFDAAFNPAAHTFEITVRNRCIRVEGCDGGTDTFSIPFLTVLDIAVVNAAEPGPFCRGRVEDVIAANGSGFTVRRNLVLPRISKHSSSVFASHLHPGREPGVYQTTIFDETKRSAIEVTYPVETTDSGRTWLRLGETVEHRPLIIDYSCFDKTTSHKVGAECVYDDDFDLAEGFRKVNNGKHGGKVWARTADGKLIYEQDLPGENLLPYQIFQLDDGAFLLPCNSIIYYPDGSTNNRLVVFRGEWCTTPDGHESMQWTASDLVSVPPQESLNGLSEPSLAQFQTGRIFALFRRGARPASQHHPGAISCKLFSISDDGGRTWTAPEPLLYDDGEMIYSPRSYQRMYRSNKTGGVYAYFNLAHQPTIGCDPRTIVVMAEIDPHTLRVPRHHVTVVTQRHPEHHSLVRLSNFSFIEDHITGNPVIFMTLDMCEHCPVKFGYDYACYRYEVELPGPEEAKAFEES